MINYLVTGGAGFIGSHIVEALLRQGQNVRILDNFSSGYKENLQEIQALFPDHLEILTGDIRDKKICRQAVSGMDYVFHQAALVSVPKSIEDPELTQEINIGGTLNLLQAGQKAAIKKVVCASSSAVYGDDPFAVHSARSKHEQLPPNPLSPYALSKLVNEYYCRIFSKVYGLPSVALRYFNVFGPRQDPGSEYAAVIPKFISVLFQGSSPVIFGDGGQSRDFVFVGDVVQANLKACHGTGNEGEAFNVASGRSYTLIQVVEILQKITNQHNAPAFAPPRPGDIRHSKANIQKAKKCLAYRPEVGFQQGLKETVEYLRGKV